MTDPEPAWQNDKSQVTSHKSPTPNSESQITNHESQITNHKSRIPNHKSRIPNPESRITNHESQPTMKDFRLRFAPSPTGALHIGGIRTALFNYLLAKKRNGTFILRIEDTDQGRYVPGAEQYIIDALQWCGIMPTEGPGLGGDCGPYRQSERKAMYLQYAEALVQTGHAYYAFDTAEELEAMRERLKEDGSHSQAYDSSSRGSMNNSLTLSPDEVQQRLKSGEPYVIRIKVEPGETIVINDLIKGEVKFDSTLLDDKVMMKSDGMPTYHLANIVDDRTMRISHVIRGEEWLPSTAHHVLLYRAFDWEPPQFAHLPLILKPDGKGKLSKRDGKKLGIPVFPLSWDSDNPEEAFVGFREFGFDPKAVVNFLAFLGWNPGTEQEIFSLEELVEVFSLEKVNASGARFDFEKAQWFNKEYIKATDNKVLAEKVFAMLTEKEKATFDMDYLAGFCGLMKERVTFYSDFLKEGYYFFEPVKQYDEKMILKKWKADKRPAFDALLVHLREQQPFDAASIESGLETFKASYEVGNGDLFPALRIGLAGSMTGPAVYEMMALMGKEKVLAQLRAGFDYFDQLTKSTV
jgi:glutamyl-tRNA synthetase